MRERPGVVVASPDDVAHFLNQLPALTVVAPGPVVAGPGLTEHEAVRPEDLAERPSLQSLQGAGLQVHQDGPGHEPLLRALRVEDVDLVSLSLRVPTELTAQVKAVLGVESLPEGAAHLVTALPHLQTSQLSSAQLNTRSQYCLHVDQLPHSQLTTLSLTVTLSVFTHQNISLSVFVKSFSVKRVTEKLL